ncbi:hypothetical protein N7495_001690 [Penicillium taxi]|uniref:uncharacterized protein n=1 Tax=Penicillium taxi TaxID=168475 RepID=UPI0025459FAB|nr:uncharacterized protein N7495_001690 [Penicillium taxi]KAJ5909008.1 hypothetical protein N7495_001690 [Penicillium taxi]
MPQGRKRTAQANSDSDSEPETQRPRADSNMSDSDSENNAPTSTDAMVKKMVRMAISSEYARLPIRRGDISTKVLGEQGARQFKKVFESAQNELRNRFGMEMTELPAKEKVTITQRRAAQKTEKSSSTTKSWVVTSVLPHEYRNADILIPAKVPSTGTEATYIGLYTFIIAVIALNGGTLPEQKIIRYLARMRADDYTPLDRTDKFLARLCKEGYLSRSREMDGGDEVIEYMLGPRGKIEVGSDGVAGLVKEVYGFGRVKDPNAPVLRDVDAYREAASGFEEMLRRSLGIIGTEERRAAIDAAERGDVSD